MKTVFTNAQCAHVWAQQTQAHGKSGTMFFTDNEIWSYGYHFKAAKIHTIKGRRFALINCHVYSPTTGAHLSQIRSALRGLMPFFNSTDVDDPKAAVKWLDSQAKGALRAPLKRKKVASDDTIQWEMERIRDALNEANALRKILGRALIKNKIEDINKVREHLDARLARYRELNTPEIIAKRERVAKEKAEKRDAELIARFRAGERVTLHSLRYDLLYVTGNRVRTSRGAEVPLADALRLYRALKSGNGFSDKKVGAFTFSAIYRTLSDPLIVVGCHRIYMSEADTVLGKLV